MDNSRLCIKSWSRDERPREKLLSNGHKSLSDAELLAILIGSGYKNETALDVGKKLLLHAGNSLHELAKMSTVDLMKHKGIGEAKAVTIAAAMELGRRRSTLPVEEKGRICSSKDAYDTLYPMLADLVCEEFWIILLNRANRIVERKRISQGGISGTVTDIKIIIKHAIDNFACSIILCHNHPSGNLNPSKQDNEITQKLVQAGSYFEIKVLDHLIVSDSGYFSYADEGLLSL